MINVFEPNVTESDIEQVNRVLNSNWLGKGLETESFEANFATFIGCAKEQVLSVNSCTQAAFILAEFLSVERDIVIMPSMSFVGVANAFARNGYEVHFVDVSMTTLNVEVADVKDLILEYGSRAVLVLNHFMACSDSLVTIVALCESQNTILVEDAAGVLGARQNGKSLGTFGDFGIWSFDAMKTITCGDGGMIYSRNPQHAIDLTRQAYLGLVTESGYKNSSSQNQNKWWEFQISGPYNRSIMNDVSASLGLSQLGRIDEILHRRELIAAEYSTIFRDAELGITPFKKSPLERNANYIFPILIESQRDQLASFLKVNDIYTTFRYFPLHEVDYYAKAKIGSFPVTRIIQDSLLLLPIHPNLTVEQVRKIGSKVVEFLNE